MIENIYPCRLSRSVLCAVAVGLKVSDRRHGIFGCPLDVGIVEYITPVIKFLHSSDCKCLTDT